MNLILFSHLFTNTLFNSKEEIFADESLSYLDYIIGNWNKLKELLEKKGIDICAFMNLIYKDLSIYLNKQKQINNYSKSLEIEKEIENIIENKISKYSIYLPFYQKNREKDSNSKISIIKEINGIENYKEGKDYPYYKNFLYSDYPDINFFKRKLEEKNKEKYPVVDLYLNKENNKRKFNEDFIYYNFVIKLLLNEYSGKITRYEAKKLAFEKTIVYKLYQKECDKFIEIINSKFKEKKLTKESSLDNFFIDASIEKGAKLIEIYKEYAQNQNNLLRDIIDKINAINNDVLECQEIYIQEAQKRDLVILNFENKSESDNIFLINTYREIYDNNSKIKYNNYNLYSVDFDKIEKILEDTLIRNVCLLKMDEIIEMKYSEEDFLNDGISEFNKNIKYEKV